jgi:serine/threonine-protein kinase
MLAGHKVLGVLGRGGVSVVYAVRHPETNQTFAIKHLICDSKRAERHIEEFAVELELGKKIAHANLRRVMESQVRRNWLRKPVEGTLLMELVEGLRLDRIQLPEAPVLVGWFIDLALALQAVHKAHYVHCAVKPSNVLITRELKAKLIDLGQACPTGTKRDRAQGSPEYLAPEQVVHAEITPQADVYALGATIYWALTGRMLPGLLTVQRGGKPALVEPKITPPTEVNPLAPQILSNLAMECVRINPAKRPAGMADLIRRLETIQYALTHRRGASDSSTGTPPPKTTTTPTKPISLASPEPAEAEPTA